MLDLFGMNLVIILPLINTEEGTTSGDVTVSSYADIKANKILLGSSELTENIVSSLSGITLGTAAASKRSYYRFQFTN